MFHVKHSARWHLIRPSHRFEVDPGVINYIYSSYSSETWSCLSRSSFAEIIRDRTAGRVSLARNRSRMAAKLVLGKTGSSKQMRMHPLFSATTLTRNYNLMRELEFLSAGHPRLSWSDRKALHEKEVGEVPLPILGEDFSAQHRLACAFFYGIVCASHGVISDTRIFLFASSPNVRSQASGRLKRA